MSAREDLPAPQAALFPARDTRTRVDDLLTRLLADAGERILQGPVMPSVDRAKLREELAGFDFATPRPLEELSCRTAPAIR